MDVSLLAGFALVSLTLACTPGADWAYIISSAITKPRFLPAILGLLSGYLFHTALVACGVAALVANSPGLLSWLTGAGAVYLLWLGVSTLRTFRSATFHDGTCPDQAAQTPHERRERRHGAGAGVDTLPAPTSLKLGTPRADFLKGLLTSATNPKALLLYIALIPQFISVHSGWPLPLQTAALGLAHFAVSILVYFAVALTARLLLRSRPLAARLVTLFSGAIMIILAVGLVLDQLVAI